MRKTQISRHGYGQLIGKGEFSAVYRKESEPFVTILSNDPVKECMSLDMFPHDSLFPPIERIV